MLGTEVIEPIRGDALDYYHYAHNLRESGTYSRTPATGVAGEVPPADAFRRPGYALFILPWIAHPPTVGMLLRIGLLQGNLPPALIVTAEFDPLRDEGEAYGRALQAAGNKAEICRYDGLVHDFFATAQLFSSTRAAFETICGKLRQALST